MLVSFQGISLKRKEKETETESDAKTLHLCFHSSTSPLSKDQSDVMKGGVHVVFNAASRPISGELSSSSVEVQYAAFHPWISSIQFMDGRIQSTNGTQQISTPPSMHIHAEQTLPSGTSISPIFSVGKRNATSAVVRSGRCCCCRKATRRLSAASSRLVIGGKDMHAYHPILCGEDSCIH